MPTCTTQGAHLNFSVLFFSTGAVFVNGEVFGANSGTVVLGGIQCSGRETDLLLCQEGTWGNRQCPSGNAGIACEQTGVPMLPYQH